jgi:hypothetical protein
MEATEEGTYVAVNTLYAGNDHFGHFARLTASVPLQQSICYPEPAWARVIAMRAVVLRSAVLGLVVASSLLDCAGTALCTPPWGHQ